jgi:hypothetical protein
VPPHCQTLAALRALDEEELHLQTIALHGEHAAKRPSWMLLERIRGTCACEDRRPSVDVDMRAHLVVEQDTQAALAALLKGEGQ